VNVFRTIPTRLRLAALTLAVAFAAGCGSHSQIPALDATSTGAARSPALAPPAPMARTTVLPASAMLATTKKPDIAMQAASYSQIPGSASFAAASADGSLWVLSDLPNGPDKYIWHYSNATSTWTNISGLASRLAIAPDGTMYAINSGGGIYKWDGTAWSGVGGGASDITVDYDGSLFVISNGGTPGTDRPIWHYSGGTWTQSQGAGVRLISSWWDTKSYGWLGGAAGGMYVLNAAGNIYHEVAGTAGFVQLPGQATELAVTSEGGYYVLGYPRSAAGNIIYYFDLDSSSGTYAQQPGAGTSITTNSSSLYVISASGGIYSSPVKAALTWTFGGSNASVSMTNGRTPSAVTLTPYNNVSVTLQFAQVTSGSGVVNLASAMNNGDINPNTVPADNATAGYTPIVYFSVANPGPQTISTGTTVPSVSATKSTGFGTSTSCNLDIYLNTGGGAGGTRTWNALPGATAAISGNTVAIPSTNLPAGSTVDFQPGNQSVLAIACH